jgi:hypothetical protein
MKKDLRFPLIAVISILLCAFSVAPAPASEAVPSMGVRITSDFTSDGSGKLSFEMSLSQEFMTLMKSFSGGDNAASCDTFFESSYDDWEMTEKDSDGALICTAETTFEDLDEYESIVQKEFSNASFSRLEIDGGRFYYDLMPNMAGSAVFGEMEGQLGFDMEMFWILKMPGEVVDSNATEKSGQTLTWDILELNASSHIRAESKTGGGLDPTLAILAVIGLLCCCGLIVVIAAVVVFFVLRKRNQSAAAAG